VARILLGVSGGIAAYKALELARLATIAGHSVRVLMTANARRFIGAASFEGIVGAPELSDEFERDPLRGSFPGSPIPEHDPIGHLAVVENADAFLVAPASANTVAKLASGMTDSMVTAAFLACTAPRLVAPAMNNHMFEDKATQANLERLRDRGVRVIEPGIGPLAARGERGVGRLPDPQELLAAVEATIPTPGPWDGLRVLITAGGTREPIDPVRFVGNRSSGRMGLALAEAARRRGADVTLVAANVGLPEPPGVRRIEVETVAELAVAAREALPASDLVLMAAAVSDFRPVQAHPDKIAREGSESLTLTLEPTDDVLASLARERKAHQTLVGFAAESGQDGVRRARMKLERKGVDAVVVNDVSDPRIGFDSTDNEVTIVTPEEEHHIDRSPKSVVAERVCEQLSPLIARRTRQPA